MKREAAAIKIQTYTRGKLARKCYTKIRISAITLQTGLRAIAARAARDKLRYRKQTSASTNIQVRSVLVVLNFFKILLCCLA